jgi:ABC-2 type transport system ATP-binding protein
MSSSPLILEAQNLKKRYPPTAEHKDGLLAVKGITLSLMRGEVLGLLGPNGAGKTTTISMMSGLLTPSEGDVQINGHSIRKEPLICKQAFGVVPQDIALYPTLSARANLEFFGRMYGLRGKTLQARVDHVLELITLTDRQKDQVGSFSGGMKRRVNIGVGLIHQPQLIFMDEPTVGVDPQSRRSILDTVKDLTKQGLTVLYTTHYMEEASELSDRIGIIDHGELIALGTEHDLLTQIGERDTIRLKVGEQAAQAVSILDGVTGVEKAMLEDSGVVKIMAGRGRQTLPAVIKALDSAGIIPLSVEVQEPNLETVFLHLTGRALRN